MAGDVRRIVQGCEECAISKSPRRPPAGKLLPLPVPNRPWSHLGADFVIDLPVSEGNVHSGRCGQILQVLSFDPTQESTHGHGNGGANV